MGAPEGVTALYNGNSATASGPRPYRHRQDPMGGPPQRSSQRNPPRSPRRGPSTVVESQEMSNSSCRRFILLPVRCRRVSGPRRRAGTFRDCVIEVGRPATFDAASVGRRCYASERYASRKMLLFLSTRIPFIRACHGVGVKVRKMGFWKTSSLAIS